MKDLPVNFLWPELLWLLAVLPLLVLLYWWILRRRKKVALRYASLSIVREAMGRTTGWRRHIPPLLLLLAFAAMLLAAARPVAPSSWPWTSRAACAPPTCSPTAWWPRRTPPRPSSRNCRGT